MRKIGLLKLRSLLGGEDASLLNSEASFLNSIDPHSDFLFTRPYKGGFTLFFIETGGAETSFKSVYEMYPSPYYLLVQGERNSLASALEILSFLKQKGLEGHIIIGDPGKIHEEIDLLSKAYEVKRSLSGKRLGIIGKPSDWLIASDVDYKEVKRRFGVTLVDIPIKSFYSLFKSHQIEDEKTFAKMQKKTRRTEDLRESFYIHAALKALVKQYQLDGLTLRCFDLLSRLQQTSCIAFSMLNQEGILASCEGDIPSLLSMLFIKEISGQSSFMANPAMIDPANKTAIYAHCTCPLDMLTSYTLTTHFESGLGFGIRGNFKKKDVTAVKLSSDLKHLRLLSAKIDDNLMEPNLCRSQIKLTFSDPIDCLLEDPYGNHMLFAYGDIKKNLATFFSIL